MQERTNLFIYIYILLYFIILILFVIYIGDKEFWGYGTAPALALFIVIPMTFLGFFIIIKRKGMIVGLFNFILGAIFLVMITKALINFYQDIPYYKNHDYKITEGKGKIEQNCSKGVCHETIYINDLELKNLYVPIYNLNYTGKLQIYYLPHTKLITKIIFL